MKVVVTGASGQLGREIVRLLRTAGHEILASDLRELDIGDRSSVESELERIHPDLVVNCAAYTDVERAETDREAAMRANRDGPMHLAELSTRCGALLVHYSTDFVFDGLKAAPYTEEDTPNPLSHYGRTKLDGDLQVLKTAPQHLLIRTSWVFGHGPKNFVLAIARKVLEREPLRVVCDQRGSPTYARDIADATMRLLETGARGLMNFCNDGDCTRLEYAREIARQLGAGPDYEIAPRLTAELQQTAVRPAYSTLDCARYRALTGRRPRPWQAALQDYLAAEFPDRKVSQPL
ncbi:MAG: dTDP-4-dehydrorhamnose reductase [Acidobacteriota bacterium]